MDSFPFFEIIIEIYLSLWSSDYVPQIPQKSESPIDYIYEIPLFRTACTLALYILR